MYIDKSSREFFSIVKIMLVFMALRLMNVFYGTAVNFHLIDNCLDVGNDTIGIFTVHAIHFLKKSQLAEKLSVHGKIVTSFNFGNVVQTKINKLKLSCKDISQHQREEANVCRKRRYNNRKYVSISQSFTFLGNNE